MWVRVDGTRRPIALGLALARGGEGTVYAIDGDSASAAKIYHRERTEQVEQLSTRARKLAAMLGNPPRTLTIKTAQAVLPLLVWPTHLIEADDESFSGFQMPLLGREKNVSVSLSRYLTDMNARRELVEGELCLPSRVTLCRSLAGIVADLHAQNHYVIDFKPDNLRVFRGSCIPCFLDTDSFSIEAKDGERFPASAITPECTCPELLAGDSKMESVGVNQDLFALAVMLFQILNRNIHPFVGIRRDLARGEEDLIKDRIRLGLYGYGLKPHPNIDPVGGSDHDCLPETTRNLFDQALTGTQPQNRPTAKQWKDHFNFFLRGGGKFERCEKHPQSMLHIHFPGTACPECRQLSRMPRKAAPAEPAHMPEPAAAPEAPKAARPKRKLLRAIVIAGAVLLLWYLVTH